jgi:hypothetical protein
VQGVHETDSLERRLGRLEVPAGRYRADLDLHDRSLTFSAELVRLALAGITVVGFIVTRLPDQRLHLVFDDLAVRALLSGSLVALAATAGLALLHRFYAGGAAFHHLQVIKLLLLNDSRDEHDLEQELKQRTALFLRCHYFLTLASACLIAGTGLLGTAFIRLLFV